MVYEHFHKSEQAFVDRALDWKREVVEYGGVVITPFLDKREQMIVQSIFGESPDFYTKLDGGFNIFERARLFIAPNYIPYSEEEMQIECVEIEFSSKFASISHRDVLGSLMSLGLKREKFGDIQIQQDTIQFVITKDVAHYVLLQIEKIGNTKVKTRFITKEQLFFLQEEWKEKMGTVSSLRLDAILSEIYHISRQKAVMLIQGNKVKCNWCAIESPTHRCNEEDVLSVRGYGRAKLLQIEGVTKKDKIRIKYGILQ